MQSSAIRRILVATDATEASDEVLRAAAALSQATSAALHVVHGLEMDSARYAGDAPAARDFPGLVAAAEEALDAQLRRTMPPGVSVEERTMQIYAPERLILEEANRTSADLIVLGAHRRGGGLADRFLGGTAEHVVGKGTVPCLVVRAPLATPVSRVGVALDPGDPVTGTLDLALALAGAGTPWDHAGAELRVMSVYQPGSDAATRPEGPLDAQLGDEIRRSLVRQGGAGGPVVRFAPILGNAPADVLIEEAARARLDLLVIGTRGRSALGRLLAGSVSTEVARGAPCPVLLVPPQ